MRSKLQAAVCRIMLVANEETSRVVHRFPKLVSAKSFRAEGGYGFLTSDDGREIYFHKNSVSAGAFPRLKIGTTVRFAEEAGEKGPQASTVRFCRGRESSTEQKVRRLNVGI